MPKPISVVSWHELHFSRVLEPERALDVLRTLASHRARGPVVFELCSSGGRVRYFVGAARASDVAMVENLPGLFVTTPTVAQTVHEVAGRVRITPTRLRLGTNPLESVIRSLLAMLATTRADDSITLQVILGAARPPQLAPKRPPKHDPTLWKRLVTRPVHPDEGHTSATNKAAQHVFAAEVRIGVTTGRDHPERLALGVLPAIRLIERSRARVQLVPIRPERLQDPLATRRLALRLNVEEALAFVAWPIAPDLPGQPPAHPKPLAPTVRTTAAARTFARASAPGHDQPLGITPDEARFHTLVMGPTGSGKSTVLLNLICRDMGDGCSLAVFDPKADLIRDVLARVPAARIDDVVVLDPSQATPVGFNPLALRGQSPHLVADHALSVLAALFAPLGPRTYDLLNASLLTLAYTEHPLTDLPALLTDASFRRRLTALVPADAGLAGFWATFEAYSPQQAGEVIGPTLSRLRQLLLRPGIRAMLSVQTPAFELADLFTRPRILLVPLNKGIVGGEAARLVGALLTSSLWQTALAQAAKPQRTRRPVHVYVDEVQDYLRIADLSDALAQSRSLGVAWHLAHQYRRQLSPDMRAAVDSNARNKIIFGLSADDARDLAAQAPELEPADFMQLPAHGIYAQLTQQGTPSGWVSAQTLRIPAECRDPVEVLARSQARYAPHVSKASPPAPDEPMGAAKTNPEPLGRRPRRPA